MASKPEQDLENINKEITSLIASLKALKTEFENAGKSSSTAFSGGNQNQILRQLDQKRQALLKEAEALRKQGTTGITPGGEYSTKYPAGIEERINKITAAVIRLNEAELKLRNATISEESGRLIPKEQDANKITQGVQKLNQLLSERRRLLQEIRNLNAPVSGANVIERPVAAGAPFGGLTPEQQRAREKFEESAKRAEESSRKGEKSAKSEAEARAKAAQELARNNKVFQEAIALAERYGLSLENLRKIQTRGGGITQATFQGTGKTGIPTTLNTFINESTGKATAGLSSQFRSFGQDIIRDIGQFTKWSIAIAAVYTPMQKLGELMEIMVDNESRLADAAIAANVPFEKSGEIFDAVAIAAERSGESINTTIDAYAQAIRAAGRYNDEATKTQKATALLNSSLILSKLSTLDQATAIDTLTAALLQADLELDQGEELLNKWVRVSQVANVTMDGLAVGVAVLGDAAETSGLDIDHLNALIAVLSEQSISGSKEAANTAKALIGAYQSDKAEAALTKYGFSLRRANGEVREFLDVYQDLADARDKGILTEASVSELALALGGGGVRRAKDASALINSQERLNDLAEESAKIGADSTLAQDSLAKKLQTVQTATTQASNAFQGLAQTVGDEGGVLDSFKLLLNVITGLTKGVDDLFKILGRSGPVLTTFVAGMLALRSLPDTRRQLITESLLGGGTFYRGGQFIPGGGRAPAGGQTIGGPGYGRNLLADVFQMNTRGARVVGGLGVAAAGLQNISQGKNEQALANVIGGIIGAAIGTTLGGPPGLAAGAIIGSSAAESMVTAVINYKPEWQQLFEEAFRPVVQQGQAPAATRAVPGTPEYRTQLLEQVEEQSKIPTTFARLLSNQFKNIPDFILNAVAKKAGLEYSGGAISPIQIQQAFIPEELRRKIQAEEELRKRQAGELPITAQPEIARLGGLAEQERARQLQRVSTGELRPSQFGQISERLAGFPVAAKREMDAFGQAFIDVSGDIDNVTEAYEGFLELTVEGTSEQQAQINSYVSDIELLQSVYDEWTPETKSLIVNLSTGDRTFESAEALFKFLTEIQTQAATFTTASITAARLQNLKLPSITGGITEATPSQDIELIRNQAKELQNQFYTDMNLTNEEIQHLTESLEDFAVFVERAGENHFDTISGIDQKFWDAAQKLLIEQGKLQDKSGFGFQQFDVSRGQLEQLAQQSLSLGQSWAQQFPGFETKPEDLLAITNEGLAKPIHADFKILALLLEQLNEKAQKELDGQYNIPEGATFWVPLTAAYYRKKAGAEGASLGGLEGLDTNTSATEENTRALRELAQGYRGDLGYSRVAEANKQASQGFRGDLGLSRQAQTNRELASGYRGDLGLAPRTAQQANNLNILEQLKNLFQNFFSSTGASAFRDGGPRPPSSGGFGSAGGRGSQTATPQLNTRLDLKFQSTTNMLIDGRVVATALQNHLASDLLRTEGTTGSITKRYVI